MTIMTTHGKKHWKIVAIIGGAASLLAAGIFMFAPDAFASTLSYQLGGTQRGCPDGGILSARIVGCVRVVVEESTLLILEYFSAYMRPAVFAAITLAMILFGVKMLAGEQQVHLKAFLLLIKIGLVLHFSDNLGGLSPAYFSMIAELQTLISNALEGIAESAICTPCISPESEPYLKIWYRIDCLIGKIYGFGSNLLASGISAVAIGGSDMVLSGGLLGIIGTALFSGTVGALLFFVGIPAIIMMTLFVCRSVYVYLLAITMGGVMVVMSPLFIPTSLFSSTKHLFDRWLNQLLNMVSQVMVITAAMALFFVLLCTAIENVEAELGTAFSNAKRTEKQLFSWKIPNDPDYYVGVVESWVKEKAIIDTMEKSGTFRWVVRLHFGGAEVEKIKEILRKRIFRIVPRFLNPLDGDTIDIGTLFKVPWIDFGPNHTQIVHGIAIALLSLIILCYVMSALIKKIPEMVSFGLGMGGSATSLLHGKEQMPFEGWISRQAGIGPTGSTSTRGVEERSVRQRSSGP